ncbi:hypothetical protein TNCV_1095041 [Trichonephila clavipes]|nr:hypothetical protein TNCV_1095041 [Trichonephila clavipes]
MGPFSQLAVISDAMVKTESVDTAVQDVTNVLIDAADLSIPKSSSHSFQRYKPGGMLIVRQRIRTSGSYGEPFVDIPLRRISHSVQTCESVSSSNTSSMPERILDQVCVFNYIVNYQPTVMEEGQSSEWPLSGLFYSDIGNIDCFVFVTFRCGQLDRQNILLVCPAPIHIALHSRGD